MPHRWLAPGSLATIALIAAACGSSSSSSSGAASTPSTAPASSASASSSSPAASGTALKARKIGSATVLTNAKGFTLYSFVPDTATKSNCNGSCAQIWPPVTGPATAGPGVTGKLTTITRSDGSAQAAYNGHPLYTYTADTSPGQASGNGINASGGVWHEVPVSGSAAPASSPTSGGGGY
jgi:predicted lipoprotein with Yx(FWY)xxD motif